MLTIKVLYMKKFIWYDKNGRRVELHAKSLDEAIYQLEEWYIDSAVGHEIVEEVYRLVDTISHIVVDAKAKA